MKAALISFFAWAIIFTANAQEVPVFLVGNWISTQSNDWEYGFFEKFAVYDCGFWDYSAIQQQGKTVKMALQKDGKTVYLEINQKEDSVLTIKNGKSKKQDFVLMRKRYPDYKTPDNKPFPTQQFKQDSATIIGYYRHFDKIPELLKDAPGWAKDSYLRHFKISISDFIKGKQTDYQAAIDSLGRFSLTFPITGSQECYADWGRLTRQLVFSPEDTLCLFADMLDVLLLDGSDFWGDFYLRDKQILFMGDNARLNNELLQYKFTYGSFNPRETVEKGIKNMEFLNVCAEAYENRKNNLENYISAHPAVSEKFRLYKRNWEIFQHAFHLMQHRFDLKGENFQEGYMEYVEKNIPKYNPQVYTLVREYQSFIQDYMGYYSRNTPIQYHASRFLEEAGLRRTLMDIKYHKADSLLQEPALKELWLTKLYVDDFEQNRIPWPDSDWRVIKTRITNPFLSNKLLEINNYYTELNKQNFTYPASFIPTDDWINMNDADSIFKKIIAPYKGKVILMDFWGTWCGPCRSDMESSGDIKKAMKSKDVIFMYLANNSPESAWKNYIKKIQLTGEQIVHYRLPGQQQSLLEQKLNVRSFPTYFIIDREGNISSFELRFPLNFKKAVDELEKALL